MKRIYISLIFLAVVADGVEKDIANTLKLSDKKIQKIEIIEQKYNKKRVELNSEILLKNMQMAQYRGSKNEQTYIKAINYEIKELNNLLSEIDKDREREIMSCLNFFQKIKYRKIKNSN